MKLAMHTLKASKGSRHKCKRLGRGNASGKGTYSARGMKGQRARSGGRSGLKLKGFKHFMQSTPKLRGFHSHFNQVAEVLLSELEKNFLEGEKVNLASLKEKNLIGTNAKTAKIILKGDLKKKLIIEGILCTPRAAEKIKSIGGEVK